MRDLDAVVVHPDVVYDKIEDITDNMLNPDRSKTADLVVITPMAEMHYHAALLLLEQAMCQLRLADMLIARKD